VPTSSSAYRCNRFKLLAGLLLMVSLVSGCTQLFTKTAATPPPRQKVHVYTDTYLDLLEEFIQGNAKAREEIYEWISTNAVLDSTPQNRLRLALLKALPGHAGHNPAAAELLLQSVLDSSRIGDNGQKLATVFLAVTIEHQKQAQQNRTLLAELEEIRKQVNALTTIERTVDAPPQPSPPKTDPSNGREPTENPTRR
jgi:hypothetical protein